MSRIYTTLFDSAYMARGLVMIESLLRCSTNSLVKPEIYVLAMDNECHNKMEYLFGYDERVVVGGLRDRDQAKRKDRTWQEFCWLMASVHTDEVMQLPEADRNGVTYLDADLMFFDDPELIFDDIGDHPIAITPHRFSIADAPRYEKNGLYNVSWVSFAGSTGRACLSRWAEQCIDWCYYRNDEHNGQRVFGDQKYLDEWPALYPNAVKILNSKRIGMAPWNLHESYGVSPIFFHYSGFKELEGGRGGYQFYNPNWKNGGYFTETIFQPYVRAYERAKRLIKSL